MSNENITEVEKVGVSEYDITFSPRDISLSNLVELIDAGHIKIPFFQREFVWKIEKASKLIESLILNLPVPEVFMFMDDSDGNLQIIDGQQRILSIYLFLKGKFPKVGEDGKLSRKQFHDMINQKGGLSDLVENSEHFAPFKLKFDDYESSYSLKSIADLDTEVVERFRLRRYIRAQVLRQNKPDKDESSKFEVFNRLNTGSEPLSQQEIRASLYYSDFYKMMKIINQNPIWRKIYSKEDKIRSEDIEAILSGFAFLDNYSEYKSSKKKFLNSYSRKSKSFDSEHIEKLKTIFEAFLEAVKDIDNKIFHIGRNFSIQVFEVIFAVVAKCMYTTGDHITKQKEDQLKKLISDEDFINATKTNTSSSSKIKIKFARAEEILLEKTSKDNV